MRYSVTHARGTLTLDADYDKQAIYKTRDEFLGSRIGSPVIVEGPGRRLVLEFEGTEGDSDSIVEKRRA